MRLVFAGAVFAYHACVLSAAGPGGQVETGLARAAELGIQGFFIVSGALVFGSLERSQNLGVYGSKRVRRLYPAYAVIILLPAIVSGFVTGWGDVEAIARYLGTNLIFLNFLEPNLPGLFAGNRFTEVNGALWTLKIEVMFYLALPALALVMRLFGKAWWVLLLIIYGAAEAWRLLLPVYLDHPLAPELARQLPGQMAFFASGMVLWKVWDLAKARAIRLGLAGTAILAASYAHPILEPLRAAGLAGVIACLAFAPGPAIRAARFGDISYGVYITHFPILQAMVMAGLFAALPLPAAFVLAAVGVLFASLMLWHLVEKPALRRDSHYRKADSGS
ncbi:acyltransferase [Henriciella mobilis]|uniref:acyltransferase family protein n=1 Tax=Henriciella mobilis TaxID=2305467 RepID=UPI000E667DD6|nr:acyltransferase [Henriciella mobilis]RIJ15052.1 acyltransferase [Henriciella mobilis]RIJ20222.1 acyltransferase [Henriciella mobilis]